MLRTDVPQTEFSYLVMQGPEIVLTEIAEALHPYAHTPRTKVLHTDILQTVSPQMEHSAKGDRVHTHTAH